MTTETPGPAEQEVARALARAAIYRVLGAAFAYPTAARLEELERMAASAAVLPSTTPALAEALAAFARASASADPAALAGEHVFLFDRQVQCPPYEGAYGEAQLAGKAAQVADIAGFYGAFGLMPSSSQPDVEDHIAAELEFMSALAVKEAYALAEANGEGVEVTRRAEVAFLADHLGRWAETFAERIRAATPLPYYTAAAALLAAWVRAEIEGLGAATIPLGAPGARDPEDDAGFTCPVAGPEPGLDDTEAR